MLGELQELQNEQMSHIAVFNGEGLVHIGGPALTREDLVHLPVGSIVLAKLGKHVTAFKKAGWGYWLVPGETDAVSAAEIVSDGWELTLVYEA